MPENFLTNLTSYAPIIMMVVLFAVMYIFMILPQKKRDKEIKQMRSNLEVGDIVVMECGIEGRIVSVKDLETVTIETGADKTKLKFKRWAVASKIEK